MPTASPDIQPPVDHHPQTPALASNPSRSCTTQSPVYRALSVFADNNLLAPQPDHVELIAQFAVEAQLLLFTAAVYDPDQDCLNHFFNQFVLACALPAQAP